MTTPDSASSPTLEDTLRDLEDVIRRAVPDGEIVVHFDVVVETRHGPRAQKIRVRRFSPPGSDPMLSLGLLTAARETLASRLSRSEPE